MCCRFDFCLLLFSFCAVYVFRFFCRFSFSACLNFFFCLFSSRVVASCWCGLVSAFPSVLSFAVLPIHASTEPHCNETPTHLQSDPMSLSLFLLCLPSLILCVRFYSLLLYTSVSLSIYLVVTLIFFQTVRCPAPPEKSDTLNSRRVVLALNPTQQDASDWFSDRTGFVHRSSDYRIGVSVSVVVSGGCRIRSCSIGRFPNVS